jgi:hypothetical protein
MTMQRIFVDFHNADQEGRVRLNTAGTIADLADQGVELREGLPLSLYSDDDIDEAGQPAELTVDGVVSYSKSENCWVAAIDWQAIRRTSLRSKAAAG